MKSSKPGRKVRAPDFHYQLESSKPGSPSPVTPFAAVVEPRSLSPQESDTPSSHSSPVSNNQSQINALLRKSLRGELVDTQFFLFSTRSKRDGQATKPRALFSNDEVLAASSEYFSGLFSGNSSNDLAAVELQEYDACDEAISLNDYGYVSDSDLEEEEEEEIAQGNAQFELVESIFEKRVPGRAQLAPTKDIVAKGPQRIIPNRRIMITDTAFKTWEALLYYLYTGGITFAPLGSQPSNGTASSESLHTPSACSPKSMYRLACKIKHVELQDKALTAIRSSLTERNVVQEISSSLASRFPSILEMEVESLFQHVATPAVMKDFPMLIKRIVGATDFPHGADILIRLHERIIRKHYPTTASPPRAVPSTVDPIWFGGKSDTSPEAEPSFPRPKNKGDSVFKFDF